MGKNLFRRALGLFALALTAVVPIQAQSNLPPLIATNFGTFAVRSQTSLVNNDPGINSSYSLVGGGNELWGPQDKGLFGFFTTNGNFDVRVRVDSIENVHRYAKSGIMVRESLSSSSRMVSLFATPTGPTTLPADNPVGEDLVEFNFRRATGDGSNNINLGSPGYPNAWLRMARRGSVIYGLVSHDGINWTQSAMVDTATWPAGAMKQNVLLGLGASSHDDNKLVHTELRSFTPVIQVGAVQITQPPTNTYGAIGYSTTLSVGVNDPVDAAYQWSANGSIIPGATNATYTTPTIAQESDNTHYSVKVTAHNGTTATSSDAVLSAVTINPPDFPDRVFDFDDGEVPFGSLVFGTAQVDPSAGINGSGGLVLTRAVNDQNGSFVVQDFNSGALVDSFTVAFRLKIGPGSAKPADGFSFSFGPSIPNATFPAPQQGVGPGLAVSFDIYDNDNGEAPAIDVFYGVDPASVPLNYTGNIVHRALPLSRLVQSRYVDVIIRMNSDGKLDLLYDGEVIAYQVQTPFVPTAGGKFGFGAYSGGQNALQALDDIQIATTLSSGGAYVSSISPIGNNSSGQPEIAVTIADQDTTFDTNSFQLQLNNNSITPNIQVNDAARTTTLRYQVPSLLAPLSTNTIRLVWTDSGGQGRTNTANFQVGAYVTLPVDSVHALGTGSNPGFKVRIYQIATNLTATTAFAESVLAGERGDNIADLTIADENGYFTDPSATTTIDYDVFAAPQGFSTFPGIPGLTDSREDFAAEILANIEFPQAGFYQMGIRSDDGFRLYAGDLNSPVVVGFFEGERQPANTIFGFVVPQAGIYPFRLLYYQSSGGASLRWFSATSTGQQVLINDQANSTALRAYQTVSGGVTPTRLSVTKSATGITITWSGGGVLETTPALGQSWQTVSGAGSPYNISNPTGVAFYRVRQ